MTDPFADAPTNDEFNAAKTTNDAFETSSDKKENKTVAVNAENEGKLTITLKGGAGFDAPWIVIHAADAADGLQQMQDENLKMLMDVVKRAGSHFSGGNGSAGRPQQAQQSSTPPQQQAPSGETKNCAHGEMVFRSGVSKSSGKPYKGFFCPSTDRNAQCSPQFIR